MQVSGGWKSRRGLTGGLKACGDICDVHISCLGKQKGTRTQMHSFASCFSSRLGLPGDFGYSAVYNS